MSLTWPPKYPGDVEDFRVDWLTNLAGDTINTSVFALVTPAGLTMGASTHDANSATLFLSGGTPGQVAELTNTIVTTGNRTYVEEITLAISAGMVIESGTGLADANSWVTVETADAYCATRGLSWSSTRALKEQALIRGADFMQYALTWKGTRVRGRLQGLPWPRGGVWDEEGWPVLSNEIPIEVTSAQIELAVYELAHPGGLTPAIIPGDKVKSEKIGPLEIVYADTSMQTDTAKPVLSRVDDLISGLLDGGGGTSLVGSSSRSS